MDRAPSAEAPGTLTPPADSLRDAAALLILVRSGRLAADRYASLVEDAGSGLAVLERERLQAAPQTSFFADPVADLQAELARVENEIATWRAQGLRLHTVLDAGYPEALRAVHDRPPLVFVAGRLKPRDGRAVAVIGSRDASPLGLKTAAEIAAELVAQRFTVVSGLAAGIDTAAHTAALKRGGRTIAVIGTGLSRCYPSANVILQRRIAAECAVISQFEPAVGPSAETFRARNAVISGLSLASVIVEADHRSGTRIVARCALAQGRPVFLLESLLEQRWARELAEHPAVHVAGNPAELAATVERITALDALVA